MTATTLDLRDFPPVEENIDTPDTLRQSLLARHNVCPRSAYLTQTLRTSSIPMDRGTAFHAFVERAIKTLEKTGEVQMPGAIAAELADAVMAEEKDLVLPTEEQDAVRLMAHNWAESFVLDWNSIVGVEVPLTMQINGWDLTCRIDLIEAAQNTLYIRDWKTSLAIRKSEDVQRGFQGMFYALACLEGVTSTDDPLTDHKHFGAGINDVWFYEVYPRYRTEEGPLIAKEGVWSRVELAEFKVSLERNVAAFEESLETGKWPARDGSHCSQCPAPNLCPIPEHLRSVPEITTEEQAQDAFSRKMAIDREGRRLQTGMREWVKENGAIYVGDLAFDASLTQSRSVNWDAVEPGKPLSDDAVQIKPSTKFAKRKQTEEEINARPR